MPPQVDLLFAAVAGVLTAFSPCGVPFLPALWTQQTKQAATGLGPALYLGGFLSGVGLFLLPFGTAGALASAVLQPIAGWLVFLSGVVVLVLAALMGRGFGWRLSAGRSFPRVRGTRAEPVVVGFAYAMGSIGCTAPIFFAVLLFAVSSAQPVLLAAFVLSLITPLGLLAILAREFGDTFREALAKRAHLLEVGGRVFLAGLGVYLIAFFFVAPILGIPL